MIINKQRQIFLVIIAFSLSCKLYCQNDSIVKWESLNQLTWNCFKGTAYNDDKIGAIISCSIYYQFIEYGDNNCFVTKLFACIYPYKSSFNFRSNTLLAHEQTHFNISEYFARLFRKKISELADKNGCLKCNILTSIYNEIMDSLNVYQSKYDTETLYSKDEAKQIEWNEKVKKLIEDLEEWAEPIDFE